MTAPGQPGPYGDAPGKELNRRGSGGEMLFQRLRDHIKGVSVLKESLPDFAWGFCLHRSWCQRERVFAWSARLAMCRDNVGLDLLAHKCCDNAMDETVFKTIKNALIWRTGFQTRRAAHLPPGRNIDGFRNPALGHSSRGCTSPESVEAAMAMAE